MGLMIDYGAGLAALMGLLAGFGAYQRLAHFVPFNLACLRLQSTSNTFDNDIDRQGDHRHRNSLYHSA